MTPRLPAPALSSLADVTDERFTDEQRAHVARFDAAPVPVEAFRAEHAWMPGPTTVEAAAWDLVKRCRRMLDGWAESTPEVQARDLWTPLHIAAEDLANVLEDSGHSEPTP